MANVFLTALFLVSISVWVTLVQRIVGDPPHSDAREELANLRVQLRYARLSLIPLFLWVSSGLLLIAHVSPA